MTTSTRSETQQQVLRTLRPAFRLHSDPSAAATLDAYARACGQDVAAWHCSHLGDFLDETQIARDAAELARRSLDYGVTLTDDPAAFCRLYQAGFCAGYRAYAQAMRGGAAWS